MAKFIGRLLSFPIKFLTVTSSFLSLSAIVLTTKIFFPRLWQAYEFLSIVQLLPAPRRLFLKNGKFSQAVQVLATPAWTVSITEGIIQGFFPDLWRTICYWKRLLPIYAGYLKTKFAVRNLPYEKRKPIWDRRHEWGGEKVYRMILEMSGFYVKSAQILASKSDFMPEPWTRRLSVLFDSAPPRSFVEVSRSMQGELAHMPAVITRHTAGAGSPQLTMSDFFLSIDPTAIAAASVAQVHGAVLLDGSCCVIKVQHLGMDALMRSDLRNIGRVAKFLKNQLPFDLTAIVSEIQQTIPLEFNFLREVWFMKRIKHNLAQGKFSDVVCPSPIDRLCTQKMITMERLEGTPYTQIIRSKKSSDSSTMAVNAVKALLHSYGQMILIDGVFHADPHPGNLFLLPDGRLGLIDFGQCKVLEVQTARQLAKLVLALAGGNVAAIAESLTDCGMRFGSGDVVPDNETLAKMAYMMFDTRPLPEATVSPLSQDSILQTNPLTKFNQELWLVVRTVLLLRGLCHSLDMDCSAVEFWKPFALLRLEMPSNGLRLTS